MEDNKAVPDEKRRRPEGPRFACPANPDGEIIQYEWDFGDLTYGEGKETFHIYTEEGTFIVRLTVTDDDEAKSTRIKEVKIYPEHELPIAILKVTPESLEGDIYTQWEFDGSESKDQDKDGFIILYEFQIYRLKDDMKIGTGQKSRISKYNWYFKEEHLFREDETTLFKIRLDVVDDSYASNYDMKTITVYK